MIYVVQIKKDNSTGANLKDIEKHLKTDFESYDYMQGWCDAYFFGNHKILTLEEFEEKINHSSYLDNYYYKFLKIYEKEEI